MKKGLVLFLAATLALSFCACGQKDNATSDEENMTYMANPNQYDVGKDAMVNMTGIDISAPEGATNVSYDVIGYESENPMAEVVFTLGGDEYCYRAQKTSEEISIDESNFEDNDISGIYTTWKSKTFMNEKSISGVVASDDDYAVLAWADNATIYSISVNRGLSSDEQVQLYELANSLCTGDASAADGTSASDALSSEDEKLVGAYIRDYEEEISGQTEYLRDVIYLLDDHTCEVEFSDGTFTGEWNSEQIILGEGKTYGIKLEDYELLVDKDGELLSFTQLQPEYPIED